MFYEIHHFPHLENLRNNISIILDEFNYNYASTSLMSHFAHHPVEMPLHNKTQEIENWVLENGFHPAQTGYDARNGEWTAFPLIKKNEPINWYEVETSFPKTFGLIKNIPNLNLAAFFRLAPNAGTKEHHHTQKNIIFHMCLSDLNGESIMTSSGTSKVLKQKGDYCLFDYSFPHSSFNHALNERINMVIDFTPSKEFIFKK